MPEAEVVDQKPESKPEAKPEVKAGYTIVTKDNFEEYVQQNLENAKADDPVKAAEEAEELAKAEAKGEVNEEAKDEPEDKPKKKDGISERFSEITKKRKEAEAAAEAAKAEAEAAKKDAEEKARLLDEMKRKYEPPPSDDAIPEPQASDFQDVNAYAIALKEWTANETRRLDRLEARTKAQQAYQERVRSEWNARREKFAQEAPDFAEVVSNSNVEVSNQVRDAIIESEYGPQLLYHFAKHPEEATGLREMTVSAALRAIGRLETKLSKEEITDAKKAEAPKKITIAAVEKEYKPITPVTGNAGVVTNLTGHDEIPKTWGYEDYKRMRLAGRIK